MWKFDSTTGAFKKAPDAGPSADLASDLKWQFCLRRRALALDQALITNVGEGHTLSNFYWVGLMLAIFAVFTINTQICRAKAYRLVSSGSQLAPLIFTTLLFSAIWQALLFDDTFSNQKLFGIGLIILASMVNTFLSHRKNKLALKLDTESPKTVNECRP